MYTIMFIQQHRIAPRVAGRPEPPCRGMPRHGAKQGRELWKIDGFYGNFEGKIYGNKKS